jgi:hypothetical protein
MYHGQKYAKKKPPCPEGFLFYLSELFFMSIYISNAKKETKKQTAPKVPEAKTKDELKEGEAFGDETLRFLRYKTNPRSHRRKA